MNRLRVFSVTCCLLAVGVLFVRAQDTPDLKAVLRKTIEAHGGEKNLAKFNSVASKFKGSIELLGAKRELKGEVSVQKPDKMRNESTVEFNGMMISAITVFDGKKMWVSAAGMTMEIDDEKKLAGMREEMQIEGAGGLAVFLEKPYELSPVGEVKVKGKDAIGIRVSKKGQKDFSLFIDKKTHLIVKMEVRSLDFMSGEEFTKETFITSYQDKDGAKVARNIEVRKDGEAFLELEITEIRPVEKFDDATFAKP